MVDRRLAVAAAMRAKPLIVALAVAAATPLAASPLLSPDRLDDAATGGDGFATVGDFAWRAFIALNWPAAGRGTPDRAKTIGDPGPRVWETFKSATETFPVDADGRRLAPTPWESFAGPNPCGGEATEKTIAAFTPFAEFNQPSFSTDAPANPLVARNGEYVRYETRFNALEFATFAANGWSEGRNLPDVEHPAHFPVGSIALKAAWRPLNAADSPAARARYYVTRAAIVDVAGTLAAGHILCKPRDIALVGLHIAIKTPTRPQWIWASFEHVDNVPPAGVGAAREPDAADAQAPYGFFDPARAAKLWPPFGAAATLPIDATNPPKPAPAAMQIVRRHPINAALMATNRDYWAQSAVKGTVWEHYMLVAAQWPTSSDPPGPANDGAYFPGREAPRDDTYKSTAAAQENLVNTTLESYLQEAPSSCMGCHQAASNQNGFDFVGALAHVASEQPVRRPTRRKAQ
ncbi:MAG: hypothetical protein KGM15_00985 [Pseudomonadota bacterium]|nr:hypothetical protein [Pseudomonadota bacterium]